MRIKHVGWVALLAIVAILAASVIYAETPEPPAGTATPETDSSLIPQSAPVSEDAAGVTPDTKRYGMVVGRLDDRGFNALAWAGMEMAAEELGTRTDLLHAFNKAETAQRVEQFINLGYDGIVTVGFDMADATRKASVKNLDIPFAIVDFPSQTPGSAGLLFDVDSPSFMAGYLAAGMSESGTVCTFGGMQTPPVMAFMAGFENGVFYYNTQKKADVKIIGWKSDPANPIGGEGDFVGTFNDIEAGQQASEKLAAEGCDIIFPVAGRAGLGSAAAAPELNMTVIGVDADQAVTNPEFAGVYLTSVVKHTDLAVLGAIRRMHGGTFPGGTNYIGTLEDGAVDLAPLHEFEDKVPQELKDDLVQIRQGLIDGSIPTGWPVLGTITPATKK